MCGISRVYRDRDGVPAGRALLERQAPAMRHRGPDDAGVWSDGSAGQAARMGGAR